MAEGSPIPPQELTTPQHSPFTETAVDSSVAHSSDMVMIPGLGVRDIRKLFPPQVELPPKEAQKLQMVVDLGNAIPTEEQVHTLSSSTITDILTKEEVQKFNDVLQDKKIITDYGEYFEITDEAVDALSQLSPEKRHAVLTTSYARFLHNKKKKTEANQGDK